VTQKKPKQEYGITKKSNTPLSHSLLQLRFFFSQTQLDLLKKSLIIQAERFANHTHTHSQTTNAKIRYEIIANTSILSAILGAKIIIPKVNKPGGLLFTCRSSLFSAAPVEYSGQLLHKYRSYVIHVPLPTNSAAIA
jgi:hypothetical protein